MPSAPSGCLYSSLSASNAASKHPFGACTSPAPTMPIPGSRWAMPVFSQGVMPVAHDLAHVNPDRRAAEVERRDRERRMLAGADLVHVQRGIQRVLRRAADELDDGRRACQRKSADPTRFSDRAVADVGVGVGRGEAGQPQALDVRAPAR